MFKVSLIVVSGKPEGKMITLPGSTFRIGRDESCQMKANSPEVSRRHAEINITDEAVIVTDLGSRNGTLVNNQLIKGSHILRNGELLKVGPLTFAVSIQADSSQPNESGAPAAAASNGTKPLVGSDEVPQEKIETWLIAGNARPTPDRPSGVYDGDTLTIDAYQGAGKPPSSSAQPAATPFDNMEFDRLEEGAGDADEEGGGDHENEDTDDETAEEEFFDENNPFYMEKKKAAAAAAAAQQNDKNAYKDTSDAANDILRKMLERRRGRT